jgi:bacterioferritin (cytochrome b1)
MQQVKTYQVNINQDEINALNDVVDYILANEYISFEEYLEENGDGEGHIYDIAMRLRRWIDKGGKND